MQLKNGSCGTSQGKCLGEVALKMCAFLCKGTREKVMIMSSDDEQHPHECLPQVRLINSVHLLLIQS